MAGHSKWHNIKHKKQAQDKKRAKLFAKLGREIAVAARDGGDPETNPTLRLAIDRARSYDMPNDNIERAIKRGTGEDKKAGDLEQILYEGYGPDGIPLLISVITDNRNRTVAELRHLLEEHNGKLGERGSVRYQFQQRGALYLSPGDDVDRETVELSVIDAGAEDLEWRDDVLRVTVPVNDLHAVKKALDTNEAFTVEDAALEWMPQTPRKRPNNGHLERLLEKLKDHDDVTDIFTPFTE